MPSFKSQFPKTLTRGTTYRLYANQQNKLGILGKPMTITAPCRQCRQPVTVTLDDATPEIGAEAIAGMLYCFTCAIERVTQHTAESRDKCG